MRVHDSQAYRKMDSRGGKELGKCTHQWTRNDEKNKQALSTLSVFDRLKNKDRQQLTEERSREEDRREREEATKLDQKNFNLRGGVLVLFCFVCVFGYLSYCIQKTIR